MERSLPHPDAGFWQDGMFRLLELQDREALAPYADRIRNLPGRVNFSKLVDKVE